MWNLTNYYNFWLDSVVAFLFLKEWIPSRWLPPCHPRGFWPSWLQKWCLKVRGVFQSIKGYGILILKDNCFYSQGPKSELFQLPWRLQLDRPLRPPQSKGNKFTRARRRKTFLFVQFQFRECFMRNRVWILKYRNNFLNIYYLWSFLYLTPQADFEFDINKLRDYWRDLTMLSWLTKKPSHRFFSWKWLEKTSSILRPETESDHWDLQCWRHRLLVSGPTISWT